MKILSSSVLLVVLLVAGVVLGAPSQNNITFETPPAIMPRSIFNFTNSSQDGVLIMSPKLEILDLMKIDINATYSITNLSLSLYNRSAMTNNRSLYQLSLPGNWLHV